MYYFIPSWYNNERTWFDTAPLWFRVYNSVKFDDTINQYRMFSNADEEAGLLILNYQPQLRYYFHKQDLLGAQYWSFFDDIQSIHLKHTVPIDFKALNWPEGTNFVYTPFSIIARNQQRETIAVIDFAENGNIVTITNYSGNETTEILYFDDRGFISSILYYVDGEPCHQDYLNRNGVWQIREYLIENMRIEINPLADCIFDKYTYHSWEELLKERLQKLKTITEEDILVISSDRRHNTLLFDSFPNQKKIFSFFSGRNEHVEQDRLKDVLEQSKVLLVDSLKLEEELQLELSNFNLGHLSHKISRVSPFDTRLRLGNSQMIKELIIYFFIDTISEQEAVDYCKLILESMAVNPLIHLQLVTFRQDGVLKRLEAAIEKEIHSKYDLELFFRVAESEGENQIDEATELELKSIIFSHFTNETQIIKALDKVRLVLDLGEVPDLYTQIASISAGLPQVNSVVSEYVEHQKNGWILQDDSELNQALHYYFDGLANWNRSIVYAVQKMADYTSGRILDKWKSLLYDEEER
ncbi:accessory Sec system protein Asp1 [Streptococcus cameli]